MFAQDPIVMWSFLKDWKEEKHHQKLIWLGSWMFLKFAYIKYSAICCELKIHDKGRRDMLEHRSEMLCYKAKGLALSQRWENEQASPTLYRLQDMSIS